MTLSKIVLMITMLAASSVAMSHGYIEIPESRAYKCQLGSNTNCGPVQYEPQSIEQTSGFPTSDSPADGELASGGISRFKPLDRQGVNIWAPTTMKSGLQKFTWHNKAPHNTKNWRYYITKQDWNPNKPISRDSFESSPFCEIDGHGELPGKRVVHECQVPERTGYQVIYGVWEISNTSNSFYQVVDAIFEGDGIVSEWSNQLQGQINGHDLTVGDKVIARFFDDNGEVTNMYSELDINSESLTDKNLWSKALAEKINATHVDVRAGVKDKNGIVNPISGNNYVFAKKNSKLKKIITSYEENAPIVTEDIHIDGLNSTKIKDGKASLTFNAMVKGKLRVEARVYDHLQKEKGYLKTTLVDTNQKLKIDLSNVSKGHHILKVIATNYDEVNIQPNIEDFNLEEESTGGGSSDYNYVFPKNIMNYHQGTKVLQPKNMKVYECKPYPYSGYCTQWSTSATQFEPGVGSNWQDAWILKK